MLLLILLKIVFLLNKLIHFPRRKTSFIFMVALYLNRYSIPLISFNHYVVTLSQFIQAINIICLCKRKYIIICPFYHTTFSLSLLLTLNLYTPSLSLPLSLYLLFSSLSISLFYSSICKPNNVLFHLLVL